MNDKISIPNSLGVIDDAFLFKDMKDIVLDGPETITWIGHDLDFPAVFTDWTKTDTNELGGFVPAYDANVHAETVWFPKDPTLRPNVGDMFQITGKTFLIEQVVDTPDDVEIQFNLRARG